MKLLLAIILAFSASIFAQPTLESLQRAEELYLEGLQAEKDNDRAKAAEAWKQAVDIYSNALAAKDFDNARLRYNLANVYLARKQFGLAIHHYRLANRLEPDNERIAANLDLARSLRKDHLASQETDRVLKTLFAFHYDLSFQVRMIVFITCYMALFIAIIVRIFTKRHVALTSIIAVTACIGTILAASLVISLHDNAQQGGVITAPVVHAKVGSSNSYQDAFETPLHDGTEFILIGRDDSSRWLHIRLDNASEGWIPVESALLDNAEQ